MKHIMSHNKQYIAIIVSVSLVIVSLPVESLGRACLATPGYSELGKSILDGNGKIGEKSFPTPELIKRWEPLLKKAFQEEEDIRKEKILNEQGKIKDLPTLMSIKAKFFKLRTGKDGLSTLYSICNDAIIRYGLLEKPEIYIYRHHYFFKIFDYVREEDWPTYKEKRKLEFAELQKGKQTEITEQKKSTDSEKRKTLSRRIEEVPKKRGRKYKPLTIPEKILEKALTFRTRGKRLSYIMKGIGLSIEEFAKRADVLPSEIEYILNNEPEEKDIRTTIEKIAHALGIDRKKLYPRDTEKIPQSILEEVRSLETRREKLERLLRFRQWSIDDIVKESGVSKIKILKFRNNRLRGVTLEKTIWKLSGALGMDDKEIHILQELLLLNGSEEVTQKVLRRIAAFRTISRRIKESRIYRGLSGLQLANRTGVSPKTIHEIEHKKQGRYNFRLIAKIANVLKIDIMILLFGKLAVKYEGLEDIPEKVLKEKHLNLQDIGRSLIDAFGGKTSIDKKVLEKLLGGWNWRLDYVVWTFAGRLGIKGVNVALAKKMVPEEYIVEYLPGEPVTSEDIKTDIAKRKDMDTVTISDPGGLKVGEMAFSEFKKAARKRVIVARRSEKDKKIRWYQKTYSKGIVTKSKKTDLIDRKEIMNIKNSN